MSDPDIRHDQWERDRRARAPAPAWRVAYKCRRCGGTDERTVGDKPAVEQALSAVVVNAMTHARVDVGPGGVPLGLLDVHDCVDGGLGISDLIGGARSDFEPPRQNVEFIPPRIRYFADSVIPRDDGNGRVSVTWEQWKRIVAHHDAICPPEPERET